MQEGDYILEYSEQQGKFHFNDGTRIPESFGWSTVCKSLSYNQCLEFVERMEEKYPSLRENSHSRQYPELDTIKEEFVEFLLT